MIFCPEKSHWVVDSLYFTKKHFHYDNIIIEKRDVIAVLLPFFRELAQGLFLLRKIRDIRKFV